MKGTIYHFVVLVTKQHKNLVHSAEFLFSIQKRYCRRLLLYFNIIHNIIVFFMIIGVSSLVTHVTLCNW